MESHILTNKTKEGVTPNPRYFIDNEPILSPNNIQKHWSELGFLEGDINKRNVSLAYHLTTMYLLDSEKYDNRFKDYEFEIIIFPIIYRVISRVKENLSLTRIATLTYKLIEDAYIKHLEIESENNKLINVDSNYKNNEILTFCSGYNI